MSPELDEIVGRLSTLSVYSGRWGRASVRVADGSVMHCVGETLVGLREGNDYRFSGRSKVHPKYGPQFEVRSVRLEVPDDEGALRRYLRRNFKGCGERTAEKLVEQARVQPGGLAALREQLIMNPYAVDFSAVTRRAIAVVDDDGPESVVYRELSARLGAVGVRDAVLRRLAAWLLEQCKEAADPVSASWNRLTGNPYEPIRTLSGYGFNTADAIGRYLSFPADHPLRLAALATHALREGCERSGHIFLRGDELARWIGQLDPAVQPHLAVQAAIEIGEPIVVEEGRYYPRWLYNCEVALAGHLADRMSVSADPIAGADVTRVEHEIRMAERAMSVGREFSLDSGQRKALMELLVSDSMVHTLTAGPGCGKTALMELLVLVVFALARRRRIVFCAPTGKAAKVLSRRVSRLGLLCATVHSTLGVQADGFVHHEGNPLPADIVVVDESSMNDLALTRALFDALAPDTHVVMLGDPGQLASVGPGQVLVDLLQLQIDHHRLHETHRNDGGILEIVRQARTGRCDCRGRADVRFSHRLPAPDVAGMGKVIGTYLVAVERCGIEAVGLLMGARRGDTQVPGWNVTYMNEALRERLNPHGHKVPGCGLRVGDRILIRENLRLDQGEGLDGQIRYEQVVNGDTGWLTECHLDGTGRAVSHCMLQLDDGRVVRFPGGSLEAIELAYAMTVHAAQGSEYREVIFICTDGHPGFMHRGIVYTAFSRARDKLTVIGEDNVVQKVCARPIPRRNSWLVQRVRKRDAVVF